MKVFVSVLLGTLILIVGGVFLLTKNNSSSLSNNKVSDEILTPNGVEKISSPSATVTLVEFGDYECPACGVYHPLIKQLLVEFAGKITFVFRDFPLSQHKNSTISAYAVNAAGLQGKFWEMHDKIYETQSAWSTSSDAKDIFVNYAKDLGLDVSKFKIDIDSSAVKDKVQKGLSDGKLAKVDSTPTFFLNGEKLNLPGSYEDFKTLIKAAILKNPVSQKDTPGVYHAHFDLKVYMNGAPVNFTLSKYQESESNPLDENIHFHDGNGKIVHIHKKGATLKELFDSFKLVIPNGTIAFVNGKKVEDILNYMPQDLDKILIGSSNLNSASNDACIYSEKCSDRGTPPPEGCVGGIGTGCKD